MTSKELVNSLKVTDGTKLGKKEAMPNLNINLKRVESRFQCIPEMWPKERKCLFENRQGYKISKMKKFKISVEKTSKGYSAFCEEVPGVVSTGKNWSEIKKNFSEAFQFHLEGLEDDGEEVPEDFELEFALDVGQFFEHYSVFNVSALANYLKMNPQLLHQYKEGHKSVSEKTSLKILNGVNKFAQELLSSV